MTTLLFIFVSQRWELLFLCDQVISFSSILIPHCVLSRCRQDNNIFSIAMYLKTSVVGMNNNQLPVSSNQSFLAERYRNAIDK